MRSNETPFTANNNPSFDNRLQIIKAVCEHAPILKFLIILRQLK